MLLIDRAGDEKLVGYIGVQLRASGPKNVRQSRLCVGPRRVLPVNLHCEGDLRRVDMRHREPLRESLALDNDVDGTPVRQTRDCEASNPRHRRLIIERLGEHGRGIREKRRLGLQQLPCADIAKNENDAVDGAMVSANGGATVVDGNFATIASQEDGMVREPDDAAALEDFLDRALHDPARVFVDDVEDLGKRATTRVVLRPGGE
jgi:hypothetical protein